MRHLVDLNSKIAVVTYWEKNIFPFAKESKYVDLFRKKHFFKDALTENEEKELKQLKIVEGEISISVESVQITTACPVDTNQISTTFFLSGFELKQINDAIEKIKESYKGKKITISEGVEVTWY